MYIFASQAKNKTKFQATSKTIMCIIQNRFKFRSSLRQYKTAEIKNDAVSKSISK